MYKEHFGLKEAPFSIAPDPRYLYMSEQHREALAHLVYGFNSDGGFVLLTGDIGTGKTTVCRCLLEQAPENSAIAFIFNPKLTVDELLATVCDEFGITYPENNKSIKVFVDLINTFLLNAYGAGRKAVLIIDEAQNLSADVLEQLRLLTNLETSQKKLLQIILLGQPELRDKLSKPELHQLSQRIMARYHLDSLSKDDVKAYVIHRLSIAGVQNTLFPDSALSALYKITGGVPRLINIICDRALLGAFVNDKAKITSSILKKAAGEVFDKDKTEGVFRKAVAWAPMGMVLIVFGTVLATSYYNNMNYRADINKEPAETVTEPAIEPPHQQDESYWPDNLRDQKSRVRAYKVLFDQWNLSYSPEENGTACSHAKRHDLRCLYRSGNLRSLLILNRPALLELFDEEGRDYYAAITAVNGENATLTIDSETVNVSLIDIESRWLGSYTLLWQPPPDYELNIRTGYKGPVVQWLDEQLAIIHDRVFSGEGSLTYTDELTAEIKRFQSAEGLKPDGIVGEQTFIHINTLNNQKVPLLIQKHKEEY